jgi:HAD superfamily hydrolase (TIGR01490 family)
MKKDKIAIFDIDGTIFRKNLHFELINELVWLKVFPQKVRKTLVDLYSSWLNHEGTYEEYRLALVDLYARHIAGCSPEDVRRASGIVIPFHKRRTYIFAEQLIRNLREKNYLLVAISGSPIEIVEEYNRHYLRFDQVLGSVYEIGEDGRYTGEAAFEPTKNKGLAARQVVSEHHLTFKDSYGIGDTESDASLLELVENPIAFNPNQNLKKIAEERGWRILVEKKDVVYDLTPPHRARPDGVAARL